MNFIDIIINLLPVIIMLVVVSTIFSVLSLLSFDDKPKEKKIKQKKKKYECICGNKWKSRSNICPECNNVGWDIEKWVVLPKSRHYKGNIKETEK